MKCSQKCHAEQKANLMKPRSAFVARIVVSFLLLAAAAPFANAQAPQYELTWLGEGRPRDINESGVVAFGYASAIYDHATRTRLDPSDPAYNATWIDLEDNGDETGQWLVYHCNGINESNQIIGTASHVSGAEANRNFLLNDPLGPAPLFELIPRSTLDANQAFVCINDLGQVAEGKEINNSGVVVAEDWVKLSDGTVLPFEGHFFTGINEAGMVTGYRVGINSGPRSGRRDGGPVLFNYQGDSELIVSGSESNFHGDVNNHGDVAFDDFIYIAGSSGPVDLRQLIIEAQIQQDYEDFINAAIQTTGINDARQIIGQAQRGGVWHGFILTPIVSGPGITASPISGLTTTESGGWDIFEVVLDLRPSADVTIGVSSSNASEGTVDQQSLTFTPANWSTPQTVTVTGVDDAIDDGDVGYTIVTAAATSDDPSYNGLDADDVSVTNLDDDSPPGGGSLEYGSGTIDLRIWDNDPDGISSLITDVANHEPLVLTLTLNISHPRPSDLKAFVTGPDGTRLELFNVLGDNDLTGLITATEGDWLLEVRDTRNRKEGTLQSWLITIN